jgi:folate-dependent phosphoribosylglycinamide formyltransferase PurN
MTAAGLRVALLSMEESRKAAAVGEALRARGTSVALIVLERPRVPPASVRLGRLLLREGLGGLLRAGLRRSGAAASASPPAAAPASPGPALPGARAYAARHGIAVLDLPDLVSQDSLERLRAASIDLMVHAGAGILRRGLLGVPRLGVINAHMGVLPEYRGMNVAEWASLCGGPVGCSVHRVDAGIDTGAILTVRTLDPAGVGSIDALRARVDALQLAALAEVVAEAVRTGTLPAGTAQRPEQGRQYFAMHPALRAALERRLRGAA